MSLFVLIFVTTFGASQSHPTFIDSIPLLSQTKYLFLYAIGEKSQAQDTWDNFKNLTHLWENVKHVDESIPVVGHVEAAIFEFYGDTERAKEIFASANKGTFIVGGILLGGPAGAVAGSLTGDVFNSAVLQKPMGIIDNVVHFKEKPASDHIDAVLELTLAAAMGKGAKTGALEKAVDTIRTTVNLEMKLVDQPLVNKRVRFNEHLNKVHIIPRELQETPFGRREFSFREFRRRKSQRLTETSRVDERTPLLPRIERDYASLSQPDKAKINIKEYLYLLANKINQVNSKIMDAQMG